MPLSPTEALVLAQSMEPTYDSLRQLAFIAWAVGIAGIVLAGFAGWAVATNGLRPVRRLTAAAERVARTDDLTPIEVTGDDELARLTAAFNTMLTSLDASRQRQAQLVADAGHELRTPLTSLRTNLELLTQADASGGLPAGGQVRPAGRRTRADRRAEHPRRRPGRARPRRADGAQPRAASTWPRWSSRPPPGYAGAPRPARASR